MARWKGKLTLIQSVLSSLPIYLYSTFKLPWAICDKLNAISAAFWWKSGDRKPLYWLSWDKISANKFEGGLGIRDFYLLNQALLTNQCWRLLTDPSLLVSKILLPKYCADTSILKVKAHPKSSWPGKAFYTARDLIARHISWIVGNGESINLYTDRWIPHSPQPLSHLVPFMGIISTTPEGPSVEKIRDLLLLILPLINMFGLTLLWVATLPSLGTFHYMMIRTSPQPQLIMHNPPTYPKGTMSGM